MYNAFVIMKDKDWVDKIRSFLFVNLLFLCRRCAGKAAPKSRKGRIVTAEKNERIEERAYRLAAPLIEERGYRLWDVCFEKEGAMWYLRILFDKEGGIDSDECEALSGPLNELMDRQDFIGKVDILEVGSPGLTKRLRKPEHFKACIGERIRVTVRDEKGKEVGVFGTLSGYREEDHTITLTEDGEEPRTFAVSDCVKINSDL